MARVLLILAALAIAMFTLVDANGSTDSTTNYYVADQKNQIRNIMTFCQQGKPIPMSLCTAYESSKTALWSKDPMYTAAELKAIEDADNCLATSAKVGSVCTPTTTNAVGK